MNWCANPDCTVTSKVETWGDLCSECKGRYVKPSALIRNTSRWTAEEFLALTFEQWFEQNNPGREPDLKMLPRLRDIFEHGRERARMSL